MTNYGKIIARLIAAWFIAILAASAFHVFKTDPSRPPIALGLAVLIPIVAFALWFRAFAPFRQFTLALDPRTLTFMQSWRIVGFVFLVLYADGILPGWFAMPAGWGDVFIGITAPFVALKLADPSRRSSFLLWQALGILDLVVAVGTGASAFFIDPHGIPTSPNTVLPLSLIPTFGVPLLLILHFISIAQARRWPAQDYSSFAPPSNRSTSALSGADV
ncbi:MAG: hypothetical protein ACLPWF_22015 [Bryobacteraceae bacterium]